MNSWWVATSVMVLTACTADADLGEETSGATIVNGQNLNGQNLNGQNLNGQNLNGPDNGSFTIWTSLEGVRLQGMTMDSTTLSATVFTALKGANVRTGRELTGAELLAMRGNGQPVHLRIREIVPPSTGSTAWRYFVDYREDDGEWYPLCGDAGGPRAAIPLDGIWNHAQGVPGGGAHLVDPSKFTFACEGLGALGKCVAMGYEPWSTYGSVQLAPHHQACVRMMRGDYCGDGTLYTQNGNRVNVYDALRIQEDTESWVFEAEWDANGARCFSALNRSHELVPCFLPKLSLTCGSSWHFSTGTLLMNETPTAGVTP